MSKFQLVMQMGPSPGKTISLGETEHYFDVTAILFLLMVDLRLKIWALPMALL